MDPKASRTIATIVFVVGLVVIVLHAGLTAESFVVLGVLLVCVGFIVPGVEKVVAVIGRHISAATRRLQHVLRPAVPKLKELLRQPIVLIGVATIALLALILWRVW